MECDLARSAGIVLLAYPILQKSTLAFLLAAYLIINCIVEVLLCIWRDFGDMEPTLRMIDY